MHKIGIIGAGAWGTALAQVLAGNDHEILIWAREPEVVTDINENNQNSRFLPGIDLRSNIQATESLSKAAESDLILLVTPAQFLRATLQALKPSLTAGKPVVICSKGLEIETGALLSHVAEEEIPDTPVGVMSGPTFAHEIARGLPSAVTLAIEDKDIGQEIVDTINTRSFRVYTSEDLIGLQIGGAVKNVIAIACGVCQGLGMGESARAALMTRGLTEMSRLVSAMDGRKMTLMGMCGIGDLVLTCNSTQSRNFSLGEELGKGRTIDDILGERSEKCVTEGYHTAKALKKMADAHAVDMPISYAVYACLHEGKSIKKGMAELMDRPTRSKFKVV